MLCREMPHGHREEEEVQKYVHLVQALETCGYSAPRPGRFSIGAGLNGFGKPRPHQGSNPDGSLNITPNMQAIPQLRPDTSIISISCI